MADDDQAGGIIDGGAEPAAGGGKRRGKRIPPEPHMPAAAVAELKKRLYAAQCYLEFGAGGSTRLAARMQVPQIFSVESDAAFANLVKRAVKRETTTSRLRMLTPDIGETGAWGRPKGTEKMKDWPDYPLGVWDRLDKLKLSPDLVLIDGRFRVACFLLTLLNAKPGTPVLFDDYVGREKRYSIVERFAGAPEFADRMAVFQVPADVPVRDVARALPRACLVP